MGLFDMGGLAALFVAIAIGALITRRRRMGVAALAIALVLGLFVLVMAGIYAVFRATRGG